MRRESATGVGVGVGAESEKLLQQAAGGVGAAGATQGEGGNTVGEVKKEQEEGRHFGWDGVREGKQGRYCNCPQ